MPTFPAHDHLMWDARKGRDIPAELVQQERQILAWRQILLLHDIVVSREGVHLRMVVGGRFHDLGGGFTGWTQIKRRNLAYLPPHDVLPLPDIVSLQVWEQGFPDRWRGVMVFMHKVHQVLGWVILLREPSHDKTVPDPLEITHTRLPGADWA